MMSVLAAFICYESVAVGGESALPTFTDPETARPVQSQPALEFPHVLRGTELVIQHLAQYDGPFLEGRTETPVANVAALMIYNPTDQGVAELEVELEQGGEILSFYLTCLPPKSRVLVLEGEGKLYSRETVTACRCIRICRQNFEMAEGSVSVREAEGKLQITNLTGETIPDVTLLHKQYFSDGAFYLGGITYETVVAELMPGESREILPEFYAPGYCRVVAVRQKK